MSTQYVDIPPASGVTSLNGLSGALTLLAGANITITPGVNSLTISATSSAAITSINGDTTAAQTLSVGTAGTDFAIVDAGGGSHVFNLPNASATARGVLSIGSQSINGQKTFLSPLLVSDTTQSTNKDTGSIIMEGGLGVEKNINAGGNISATGALSGSNFSGSSSGTNTGDVTLTAVGSTPNANGASLSGQALTLQPANGTNPGVLTALAQTIAGQKTFTSAVLIPDGTVSLPGLAFASETNSGLYRVGPNQIGLSAFGQEGIDFLEIAANQVNVGIGIAASSGATNFFTANRTVNGTVNYNFGNASAGTSSATVFQISNGPSSNYTLIENWANTTAGYLAGGSALFANNNQLFLNVGSEFATGSIRFNVGGRTLATERMRLNTGDLTLNAGIPLKLSGATSGVFTQQASSTTASYTMTWPSAQGAANTVPLNNGSGVLSWSTFIPYSVSSITANTSAASGTVYLCDTSGGAFNVTLPTPTSGAVVTIKDKTGNFQTNNLTVLRNGTEKIEGLSASKPLITNWGAWTFFSDGTDWYMGPF